MNPVIQLAAPLIKDEEGYYRRDRVTGKMKSYADPGSPLGLAIQRKGKWSAYLQDLWEPPMSMMKMPGTPWTIGWGSTGPDIGPTTVWTDAQCQARFDKHTTEFLAELMHHVIGLGLADNQIAACLSLAYNIGVEAFKNSSLLRLLRARDIPGAAAQFPRWNKAGKRILPGLVKRREKERLLFLGVQEA